MDTKVVRMIDSKTGELKDFDMPVFPPKTPLMDMIAKQVGILRSVGLYPTEPITKDKMTDQDPQLVYFLQANLIQCRRAKVKV